MARIRMVDEADATGPLADLYAAAKANSQARVVPAILKTMSLRPDFLAAIDAASRSTSWPGSEPGARPQLL